MSTVAFYPDSEILTIDGQDFNLKENGECYLCGTFERRQWKQSFTGTDENGNTHSVEITWDQDPEWDESSEDFTNCCDWYTPCAICVDEKNYDPEIQYLMHEHTGSVCTLAEWKETFDSLTPEMRGAERFEDAALIPVRKNDDGDWEEID